MTKSHADKVYETAVRMSESVGLPRPKREDFDHIGEPPDPTAVRPTAPRLGGDAPEVKRTAAEQAEIDAMTERMRASVNGSRAGIFGGVVQ